MAILANCSKFLFYSKTLGVSFEKTLMLGRLELYATKKEIKDQASFFRNSEKKIDEVSFIDKYAEPLFRILGASIVDSVDYSDYEHATIIHDLNNPFPDHLKNKYTTVVDGGTIEHVFNFPVAIKNCMEALQVGGHYIGITPANNLMGHGFYQFSPELYFRVLSPAFGFMVKKICLVTQDNNGKFSEWYEITDPVKVRSRIMITNSKQTYLMVLAQKTEAVDLKNFVPQQSDYEATWAIEKSLKMGKTPDGEDQLKYFYRRYFPLWIKKVLHKTVLRKKIMINEDIGLMNTEHFKKIIFKEETNSAS